MAKAKLRNTHNHTAKKMTVPSTVKLRVVVEKLQKSLLHLGHNKPPSSANKVPEDVKQGHFAVIAMEDDEEKRFIVPLSYLTHPSFLRLLDLAAEEYGFDHEGALTIPCRPRELERILFEQCARKEERDSRVSRGGWDLYKTMVESC